SLLRPTAAGHVRYYDERLGDVILPITYLDDFRAAVAQRFDHFGVLRVRLQVSDQCCDVDFSLPDPLDTFRLLFTDEPNRDAAIAYRVGQLANPGERLRAKNGKILKLEIGSDA